MNTPDNEPTKGDLKQQFLNLLSDKDVITALIATLKNEIDANDTILIDRHSRNGLELAN